ncbi:hypothetical protein C8R43DRAFT_491746 [Mycena crocata]|nr:hypothetical protein C8R43DRAFT_491746 [Mycena crocata]
MSQLEKGTTHVLDLDINDLDDAAVILRSLVKPWLQEDRHIDPAYAIDLSACSKLLQDEPSLHTALKAAALSREFRTIRHSPLLVRPNTRYRMAYLQERRSAMKRYVDGHTAFSSWEPSDFSDNEDIRSHLAGLGLFDSGDEPSMLLDRLGTFPDDPELQNRVQSIFVRGKDTFLVNTSGSGKTRLVFEGLCQEWGFYFSAEDGTSGYAAQELTEILKIGIPGESAFASELPSSDSAEFKTQLETNRRIAAHHFNAALLARLLMFQMFVEIMHETEPAPKHKMRWLLFQLRSRLEGSWDSILRLTKILLKDDDSYTNANIIETIAKIRDIFGGEFHLFYVLDEAQATTKPPSAFFTDGLLHPILPEIIRVWHAHAVDNFQVSMVISGIQIPKDIFDCEGNFSLRHRWSSNTGAFDQQSQKRYIEHFLPTSIAESQTAEKLIPRAWNWLRGRHRFTSGFVKMLLLNGFLPTDAIFDDYFNNFAHIGPTDGDTDLHWIKSQVNVVADNRFIILDFSILKTHPVLKETIFGVLSHYLVTNQHPRPLGVQSIEMVSQGFGRFGDAEGTEVLVDEPLVLAGAANWLLGCYKAENPPHSFYSTLSLNPPTCPKVLAKYVAFSIAQIFGQKRRLCDVFTFPGSCPTWAKQNAQLAGIHPDPPRLAIVTYSMADTISWLQQREATTPFCIPEHGPSNPDVIFVLKMADGTVIWVFLQAAVSTETYLKESDLKLILLNLQDDNLFRDEVDQALRECVKDALKDLPNLTSKLGPHGVLRVVASFPAHPRMGRLPRKSTLHAASLNMGLFERVNEMPALDMVNAMAISISGLPEVIKRKERADDSESDLPTKRRRSPAAPSAPTTIQTRSKKKVS